MEIGITNTDFESRLVTIWGRRRKAGVGSLTSGTMLSVGERAGPGCQGLREGEALCWGRTGPRAGRDCQASAWFQGSGFFLFFSIFFLFSKAFLNRIFRATKIHPKANNTTIRYASACMHKQVSNSMLNF